MSYDLNIQSKHIKDYKTSKYKYKKIKDAIDSLLLDFEFFKDVNIRLKVSAINKNNIIVLINFKEYNINKKIIILKEDFKLKHTDNTDIDKLDFFNSLTKGEFLVFINSLPESGVNYDSFKENKNYYKQIYDMSVYWFDIFIFPFNINTTSSSGFIITIFDNFKSSYFETSTDFPVCINSPLTLSL